MEIKPLRFWEKGIDVLLWPFMKLFCNGQRTHRLNSHRYKKNQVGTLNKREMIFVGNNPESTKKFIIVEPKFWGHQTSSWYVGRISKGVIQILRIKLKTPAKLCIGSDKVSLIGFDCDGKQIPLKIVWKGILGKENKYIQKIPLL
tara:strand:+ start:90 stop:524 length:435 start_codon:yes stop_codon:yes gene_type:complete